LVRAYKVRRTARPGLRILPSSTVSRKQKIETEPAVGNMSTSRNITTALALQAFVCHYFSFDWIKEYVMEKRVRIHVPNIHNDIHRVEEQKKIYCILHFLAKTSYEWFPTAAVLVELMTVLRENRKRCYYSPTSNLDSIYFSALAGYKICHSSTLVSNLWKRVVKYPLQYHRSHSHHYLEVKMKEMLFPYLGYLPEWIYQSLIGSKDLSKSALKPI
jgi:hypothetical protein